MSSNFAYPKTTVKTVDVISSQGALTVGCKISQGALVPAFTDGEFAQHSFSDIKLVKYSSATQRYYLCTGDEVYISEQGLEYVKRADLQSAHPFIFEERKNGVLQTVVAGDAFCAEITQRGVMMKAFTFKINCGVMKNGRLFGVDREDGYKIRWSGEGGAFDWVEGISGAGWVNLPPARGKITDLMIMDGKLIAVREYGITVISAYGNPENFKVDFTDAATPRISPHTAAVVCGKLIFICDNRVFCFDGNSVYPISCGVIEEQINCPSNAIAYGENYLVCIESKFLGRKAIFVVDTKKSEAHLADVKADMLCCGNGIIAITDNRVYALGTEGVISFYSGALDFGTARRKFLKNLEVKSDKGVSMVVSSGDNVRTYAGVKGRLSVNLSGEYFKISVAVSGGKIYSIKAQAEVSDGI